jgi:4-hydroxybenzoate polyprenyltransferase
MPVFSPRFARGTDAIGTFVHNGFYRYENDPRFTVHVAANRISKILVAFVSISGVLLGLAVSGVPLTIDNMYVVKHWWDLFDTLRLPVMFFSAFSALSFLLVYNNYVIIIHRDKIGWAVRYTAVGAIALSLCALLLSFFVESENLLLFLIGGAYLLSVLFSYSLGSALETPTNVPTPRMARSAAYEWFVVNFAIVAFLGALLYATPATLHLPGVVTRPFVEYHLIIWLGFTALITLSAVRGGLIFNREGYDQQIEAFNKQIDASRDQLTSRGEPAALPLAQHGSSTNNSADAQRSPTFTGISAILETTRIAGATAAAGLILLLGRSVPYALFSFFFLTFSFAANDVLDFVTGKDVVCHPSRPLPSRRIGLGAAIAVSAVPFVCGMVVALRLPHHGLAFAVGACSISILYSMFLKRLYPMVATPLWCATVTGVVLWPTSLSLSAYLIVFMFLYGRELLLDLEDVAGDDRFAVLRSLPSHLGGKTVGLTLTLVATIVPLAILNGSPVVAVAAVVLLASAVGILLTIRDRGLAVSVIATLMLPCLGLVLAL